jgi:hypothetical protein
MRESLEIALGESGQVRTQLDGDQLDAKLGERDAQLPSAAADLLHTRPASKCRRRDNGVDHLSGWGRPKHCVGVRHPVKRLLPLTRSAVHLHDPPPKRVVFGTRESA